MIPVNPIHPVNLPPPFRVNGAVVQFMGKRESIRTYDVFLFDDVHIGQVMCDLNWMYAICTIYCRGATIFTETNRSRPHEERVETCVEQLARHFRRTHMNLQFVARSWPAGAKRESDDED